MPKKPVRRPPHAYSPFDQITEALTDRMLDIMDLAMDRMEDSILDRLPTPPGAPPHPQRPPRTPRPPRSHGQAPSQAPSLYDVLEVSPKASLDTITAAYKSLARRYHPDNQETGNEEKMKLIAQAYDILKDEKKRRLYDRMRNTI